MFTKAHILSVSILLTSCGVAYTVGSMAAFRYMHNRVPARMVRHEALRVPVVTIDGVRNGKLTGTMSGTVRLFLGDAFVIPSTDGTYSLDPDVLFLNRVSVFVPEGMRFVASKRGARYYPVESSQGSAILPANRVYFRTGEEAEEAGYRGE